MAELSRYFPTEDAAAQATTFSQMALGMSASKILTISYAVKARIAAGEAVAPFTVGDFKPGNFAVPEALGDYIKDAVDAGQTNYPPADGVPELRRAVADHYRDALGLDYPVESVVVASGARPVLYATYRCLLNAGEKVVTPAPSWNNSNFTQLVGADHVIIPTRPEDGFMLDAERLKPHLEGARLLVLCSPMNPAGTLMRPEQLEAICDLVLAENDRREATGERSLYLIYDQVYRMLTFGAHRHVTPVCVRPRMARYTILTDAISKCFAATGLRVGWMVGPPFIAARVKALMTHMGAWAPRPEQLATARLLGEPEVMARYLEGFKQQIQIRLDRLHDRFAQWQAEGLPVEAHAPEGAIYLSTKIDLIGRGGLADEDAVRNWLLVEAGCAVVPFSAFGDRTNVGWFRFSVGAVSLADIDACLDRLDTALRRLCGPA